MKTPLTDRQREILEFVMNQTVKQGKSPSIREIMHHFNLGSLRGVTVHLDALERKGYVERIPYGTIIVLKAVDGSPVKLLWVKA